MKGRQPCIHGNLCRAIYNLTECIYSVRCPYECEFYEPVKKVKNGRRTGMTTNWTPVSEGPPKTNTNVLVTIKDDSGDSINYYTSVGWYYNGIWVVDNTVCYQVIAWMEFPKSYKEDK